MEDIILSTKGLKKKYNKNYVVNNLNIQIKQGEIYALIGRNGAGKTTFMKMITGLIHPSAGCFALFNDEYGEKIPILHRHKVGAMIEETGLMMNMSGYENLRAKSLCVGQKEDEYIRSLLETVSLEKEKNKKVKNYSLGMKQRLGIALALVSRPEFLILDEPINGLDPQGIAFVRDLIKQLNENGITILISSHILEEVVKIATNYGIIHKGKLLEELSASELETRCKLSGKTLEEYYFELIENSVDKNR